MYEGCREDLHTSKPMVLQAMQQNMFHLNLEMHSSSNTRTAISPKHTPTLTATTAQTTTTTQTRVRRGRVCFSEWVSGWQSEFQALQFRALHHPQDRLASARGRRLEVLVLPDQFRGKFGEDCHLTISLTANVFISHSFNPAAYRINRSET